MIYIIRQYKKNKIILLTVEKKYVQHMNPSRNFNGELNANEAWLPHEVKFKQYNLNLPLKTTRLDSKYPWVLQWRIERQQGLVTS